jgi:hypothetical protein
MDSCLRKCHWQEWQLSGQRLTGASCILRSMVRDPGIGAWLITADQHQNPPVVFLGTLGASLSLEYCWDPHMGWEVGCGIWENWLQGSLLSLFPHLLSDLEHQEGRQLPKASNIDPRVCSPRQTPEFLHLPSG